ncbi:GPP34 family phosphoprotein [Streptomyces sp. NPDC020800]|uniref:GPP34 family phosphoprotein n=1 Tax=Streptomyces sp. NPDC020800 TaxID=3365092 RepID=UPI0037B7C2EF
MTTARDLLIVALDVPSARDVGQGDLSLALAGAEVLDLLEVQALTLRGDSLAPSAERVTDDRLLDEAQTRLVRQEPYETVEDWLWRRGRGLASAYADALEKEGESGGKRRHRLPWRSERTAPADSPARRHATDRWNAHEPVLVGLAAALGIQDAPPAERTDSEAAEPAGSDTTVDPDALETVLAAVGNALTELEAVRQRRRIEEDAFDNVWRAP